jgi:DNA-binding HxlR family transcriptional regulator
MQVTRSRRKPKRIKPKTEARGFLRSPCAVACTLDLVGDKWSLLVVRDLLRGNVTYGELQNSPEGIPTNILADRLKRLEEARLIAKSAYQEHPVRVLIVANAMPRLMVDSQLKQGFSCHTKDVQEFGTTGCSCGKEATVHNRRTLLEDGESRTAGRSTEGAYEILPLVGWHQSKRPHSEPL